MEYKEGQMQIQRELEQEYGSGDGFENMLALPPKKAKTASGEACTWATCTEHSSS